jgi:hypothetical protein
MLGCTDVQYCIQKTNIRVCITYISEYQYGTMHTIVSSYESITIFVLQLTIHILFSLLHRNVHVSIKTSQNT